MSFDKLTLKELVRVADEDFAIELTDEEKKSKKLVIAAFAEVGRTFNDYLMANPDQREKYEPAEPDPTEGIAPLPKNVVEGGVVVKPQVQVSAEPYLIKMVRENPYYEVGKYKFTESHPYALVDAADAERVLREEGFRQAFPSELEEFYN